MTQLHEDFVVEFDQKCLDCGGQVYANEDGTEGQCRECGELYDLTEDDDTTEEVETPAEETIEAEFIVDMEDDDDEDDDDLDLEVPDEEEEPAEEAEETPEAEAASVAEPVVEEAEAEEADQEEDSEDGEDDPEPEDAQGNAAEADGEAPEVLETEPELQDEEVEPTVYARPASPEIDAIVGLTQRIDVLEKAFLASPGKSVSAGGNVFRKGTREHAIMGALLSGEHTLEEIAGIIPRGRGKAPTEKTIKTWVMQMDNLAAYEIEEGDGTFQLVEREN